MNKYINYGILSAIIAVLLFFAYKYVSRPVIVNEIIEQKVIDTIYITKPQIITKIIKLDSIIRDTVVFSSIERLTDTIIITDTQKDTFIYRVVDLRPTLPIITETNYHINEGLVRENEQRLRFYSGVQFDSRGLAYTSPRINIATNKINLGISKTINNNEFQISATFKLGK